METAVLKVLSDILSALDTGNIAMLTLLDLSAAFDSVDHNTLLRQLKTSSHPLSDNANLDVSISVLSINGIHFRNSYGTSTRKIGLL